MAYDDKLAVRVRDVLAGYKNVVEQKRFGGVAFMLDGHMCCCVLGGDLVVRVGPTRYEEALSLPHARPMDFTGRPLRGFVYVAPPGTRSKPALAKWVGRGVELVRSLPAKKAGSRSARTGAARPTRRARP